MTADMLAGPASASPSPIQVSAGTPSSRALDAMPSTTVLPGRQLWALTERGLSKVLRSGELIFAFVSPAFLAVCFYLPLSSIMNNYPGVSYGQFLMPIIVLQSIAFAASQAAMRAALDRSEGISTRFRVLPMSGAIPFLARLATNAVLLIVSLLCATIACLIIGWRPDGGVTGTIALMAMCLVVGVLIALVSDGIGLVARSPEATSQLMALPTLILGMMSTGFVPIFMFPEWIQGFARNQPISQLVNAMRALDGGNPTWAVMQPTLWWCLALGVVGLFLVVIGSRKIS